MRDHVRLDTPRKDGASLRDHLLAAEAASGQQLIEETEIPAAGEHLWLWFWDLHAGRGSNGWGPEALSYREIEAWARLYGTVPSAWEVQTLRRMDAAYLSAAARLAPKGKKTDKGKESL